MSSDNIRVRKGWWSWDLIIVGIFYLAALMISGLREFIDGTFDFQHLFSSEWWWDLFISAATNAMVLFATIWYGISRLHDDPEVKSAHASVMTHVDKSVSPVTFDPFMINYNKGRKKRAYKRKVRNKLSKLIKKASEQDKQLWYKQYDKLDLKEITPSEITNKHCRLRYEYLKELTEEWLEENILSSKIKYNHIPNQFVTTGYLNSAMGEESQYVERAGQKMFRDLAPRYALFVAYYAAIHAVVIRAVVSDDAKETLYAIILSVIPLIIQWVVGRAYTTRYRDEKVLTDYRTRKEIVGLYLDSTKKGVE